MSERDAPREGAGSTATAPFDVTRVVRGAAVQKGPFIKDVRMEGEGGGPKADIIREVA